VAAHGAVGVTSARDGVITKTSQWPVSETVARLCDPLAARGVKLLAVIDRSGEAKEVGVELRETGGLRARGPAGGPRV
jgi:uncharacterized protein (DUF302 family)